MSVTLNTYIILLIWFIKFCIQFFFHSSIEINNILLISLLIRNYFKILTNILTKYLTLTVYINFVNFHLVSCNVDNGLSL